MPGWMHVEVTDALARVHTAQRRAVCDYLVDGGPCKTGCWSEPACMTDEPQDGWAAEIVDASLDVGEAARWAIRHDMVPHVTGRELRGRRKHLRDLSRHYAKLAR